MAKSYKKEVIEIMSKLSIPYEIKVNGVDTILYTSNIDQMMRYVDLDAIVRDNKLKGEYRPQMIVQYVAIAPWDGSLLPMIGFIWSFGGPWAYVYNVQYPDLSEHGSIYTGYLRDTAHLNLASPMFWQRRE